MNLPDAEALGKEMLEAVKNFVARALAPLTKQMAEFEASLKAIPAGPKGDKGNAGESIRGEKGDTGKPGADGKDADPAAVLAEVQKAIDQIPAPKDGKDGAPGDRGPAGESIKGETGEPGKDAEPIHPDTVARMVLEEVQRAMATLPRAKDGEPGRDALAIDVLPGIDEAKSYPRGTFAEHRGGVIRAIRNTDPITEGLDKAGWVVSMNGVAEESEEILDEGRTIKRRTVYTSGRVLERELKTSVLIYRGVWREGEFQRGDVVTWSGCAWHCQEKTTDKPGTSANWKLMVKNGRDGKDGKSDAAPAPREPVKLK